MRSTSQQSWNAKSPSEGSPGPACGSAARTSPGSRPSRTSTPEHLPGLRRDVLAHLATATFAAKAENVVLLGPPGIGKTHLAIGLGVRAAQAGHPVLFDTAVNWIARLTDAYQTGRLDTELKKIRRYKLTIVDLCRDRDYAEVA